MNIENKEKLIELVRQHPCIYDLKSKEYKNVMYKSMLWEKIGATIGVQGSIAKNTWRTLRDGYIRHKKIVKGRTGSGRKYSKYTWSSQMSFLDGSLELPVTDSNIIEPTRPAQSPSPQQPWSPCSTQMESLPGPSSPSPLCSVLNDNDTGLTNTLRHLHGLTTQPPASSSESVDDQLELFQPRLSQAQPSPSQSSPSQPSPSQSSPSQPSRSQPSRSQTQLPKRIGTSNLDNTERVLDYLRNKKKREWDSVDYLFMSYAKTFKALPIKEQCKIKIELAKLFAEAESDALNSINQPSAQPESESQVFYLSQAYSVISDYVEEPQVEVLPQMDFNNEADEAVDLSNSTPT